MNLSFLIQMLIISLPIPLIFFLGGLAILSKMQSYKYTKKAKLIGFLFVWLVGTPVGLVLHFSSIQEGNINSTLISIGFVLSIVAIIAVAIIGEKKKVD